MRIPIHLSTAIFLGAAALGLATVIDHQQEQYPLLHPTPAPPVSDSASASNRTVSPALFADLEELARIVDISYCVDPLRIGITKPFTCLSRCKDFPKFELLIAWNTGPLMSDSCGYVAIDHGRQRVIVAFRGTYSVANTVVDLSTIPQKYMPYPGDDGDGDGEPECANCTVHMGFHTSWINTRPYILPELEKAALYFPTYNLTLVGHSLGGAVAALAGLDLQARGYKPQVTTFGEPRIGNIALVQFLDQRFDLYNFAYNFPHNDDTKLQYRRVTHIDDPVPLLPLTEWSFAMHAGEIFITKPSLSPDISDVHHCAGDIDPHCIAGQDSTVPLQHKAGLAVSKRDLKANRHKDLKPRDLLASVREEIYDVQHEPWGVPSRYKLWQLIFAHRDYFWRLGLCVPGGDPLGGGEKYGDFDRGVP